MEPTTIYLSISNSDRYRTCYARRACGCQKGNTHHLRHLSSALLEQKYHQNDTKVLLRDSGAFHGYNGLCDI